MLKILFIGNFLSRQKGSKGPSETIAGLLQKEGYRVVISSRSEHQMIRLFQMVFSALFRDYHILQIDVYSGNAFRFAEITSRIAKFRSKKIILTLHGGKLPEFYKENKDRFRNLINRSSVSQTPSLYLQAFFDKCDVPLNYLPNPIEISHFPFQLNKKPSNKIIWVRAFSEIYQPWLAIETVELLLEKFPDIHLTMVGPDKGKKNEIQKLIHSKNLQNHISIIGAVKNEELYSLLHNHSVFLNTTKYESFGVAVVEAASSGVPVVSTSVGEIPYIWEHERDILISKSMEASEISEQISQLLSNSDLHTAISIAAREKAEKFAWENIRPKWMELMNNLGAISA